MDDEIRPARSIQIVTTAEEHTFELDENELNEILLQDDIKDRYVSVISVAGAFRKGKSFLLDFFLRYLYARVNIYVIFFLKKKIKQKQMDLYYVIDCFLLFYLLVFFLVQNKVNRRLVGQRK